MQIFIDFIKKFFATLVTLLAELGFISDEKALSLLS